MGRKLDTDEVDDFLRKSKPKFPSLPRVGL